MAYTILSANCRGLNGTKKRQQVFTYLKSLKYDIYCLQDCHFTRDMYEQIYAEWGSECILGCFKSNSRGVAILFGKSVDYKINNTCIDESCNIISDITLEGQRLT